MIYNAMTTCDECSGSGWVSIRPSLSIPCTCRGRLMDAA